MSMTDYNCFWEPPPANANLLQHDVHIWCAWLDQAIANVEWLAQTLSTDERMRAERFRFEQDRQRFIIGRGLLRTVLGYYLGVEPGQLHFCYGRYGKPALAEMFGTSALRFSLAHAHGLALYTVSRERELGVDLEHFRRVAETEQIVDRYFSEREKAVFRGLAADKKQEAFFTYWTCKEAYLKASGEGLTRPLSQIDVSLVPGEPARLMSIDGDVKEASRWTLQELRPAPGFVAALAVEGQGWRLSCWNWSKQKLKTL
jgi:4'-phosphopantetheinyl transferase